MALSLRYAARSDVGLLREGNEDSGYASPRLLIVADGMGGAAAGEVASSVAVAAFAVLDEDEPGNDLLEVFGSRGVASEVVNGKRAISKAQARKLAAIFHVPADLFL